MELADVIFKAAVCAFMAATLVKWRSADMKDKDQDLRLWSLELKQKCGDAYEQRQNADGETRCSNVER